MPAESHGGMDVSAAVSSIRETARPLARSAAALPGARRGLLDDLVAGVGLETALAHLCDGIAAAGAAAAVLVGSGGSTELAVGDPALLAGLRGRAPSAGRLGDVEADARDLPSRRGLVAAIPDGLGSSLGAVAVRCRVAGDADEHDLREVAALVGLHLQAAHRHDSRPGARDLVLGALGAAGVVVGPDGDVGDRAALLADVPARQRRRLVAGLEAVLRGDRDRLGLDYRCGDGRWCHAAVVAAGRGRAVLTTVDITVRKEAELALERLAVTDPLTDLPNRALFADRLERALRAPASRNGRLAVLFLDLDGFKVVNDSLGHVVGDRLLAAVAQRLRASLRDGDVLARLGGDEFAVLAAVRDADDAEALAVRLESGLHARFRLDGVDLVVGASVGIALAERDADADSLVRDADLAMYAAKARGRGCVERFDERLRDAARWRLETETDLRRALELGELRVRYQPVVHLDTGQLRGVETLLHWQHPVLGLIGADEFIGVAEESSLIAGVGRWVIEEAAAQMARWHAEFPQHPIAVGVHLSAGQVASGDVLGQLELAIAASGVDPAWFVAEIAESLLVADAEATAEVLFGMQDLGVRLTIDDFGTGFSSLTRLQSMPVHGLKVDRSFIVGLEDDPADRAIVDAILRLAAALGVRVVAEGVETPGQAAWLREHGGCELVQGDLYGAPVDADAIGALLRSGAPLGPPPS